MLQDLRRDDTRAALLGPEGAATTYADLLTTVDRLRARLAAFPARQRLMTILPDGPATLLTLVAIATDHTAVPGNPAATEAELARLAENGKATGIVVPAADDARGRALADRLGLGLIALDAHRAGHFADGDLTVIASPDTGRASDDDIAVILSTSGSTGTPKLVPLTAANLTASARNIAHTLALGPDDTCIHFLPMFHIGAIVDLFLAPLLAGGCVRIAKLDAPRQVLDAIEESQATWVQGVPTMLYALVSAADPDTLLEIGRSLRFIRAVSAALPPQRQAEIEKSFGGVPIVQMYGMTETAGQIFSNPLPPAARKPGTVGLNLGPHAALLDRFGNPVAEGAEGEVCVRGETVMSGYLNSRNRDHFFGDWLRTGDIARCDADGYLTILGRLKDMINRGGEKIPALEVEQAAVALPGVTEAAAVPVPHPTLGEEVALAVVADGRAGLSEAAVIEALRPDLAEFKLPRKVVFLDRLPKLGSGKTDKKAVAEQFDPQAAPGKAAAGPTTAIGRKLSALWMKTLNAPQPGPEEDFFDAGGDSLTAQTFMLELEEWLDRPLPSNLFYDAPTFGALEETLSRLAEADPAEGAATGSDLPPAVMAAARRGMAGWRGARLGPESLIVELRGVGERTPLFFCTPTEASFVDFAQAIDPGRPFYAMRTLWLQDGRSEEAERQLAGHYAKEIRDRQPDGPILLAGHCRGVEMTRMIADALVEAGRDIGLLIEIDFPIDGIYRGPVAQIWSNDHPLSWEYSDPVRWNAFHYTGPVYRERFDVPHKLITRADTTEAVARFLEPLMERATAGEGLPPTPDGPAVNDPDAVAQRLAARRRMHAADIRMKAPNFGTRGEDLAVSVRVKNTSPETWAPTAESGLRVLARWQRPSKAMLRSLAGACDLTRPVAPGQSVDLAFPVGFHRHTTPLFLVVDMVDEGVGWFHHTRGKPARKLIVPRYWKGASA